jgi:hypothetical protein
MNRFGMADSGVGLGLRTVFVCGLTNARTEGFNDKAELVIRRAYG